MGTRAPSRQPWAVVVGVYGRGAYWNLEAPFNKGPPDPSPPPFFLDFGVRVPLKIHIRSKGCGLGWEPMLFFGFFGHEVATQDSYQTQYWIPFIKVA